MDRYEEALERAKKGLPIDEVFPELKESEDEKIRKELLEEIEFIIPHDDETDSEGLILPSYHARIDRYKSYLEKQKEQKPSEWSDEDKDMLNSCISSIEEAKENRYAYKETDGDTSYDHEIAWLKSLRNRVGKEFLQPHWKPSEEQPEVFDTAAFQKGVQEGRRLEKEG